MSNVTPLPIQPEGMPLPVVLGGGPYECTRCRTPFVPQTWHVEPGGQELPGGKLGAGTPVCPDCARKDPELAVWQRLCDAYDAIDTLMQAAGSYGRRALFVAMVASNAEHLARWRWPDEADRWNRHGYLLPSAETITDDDRTAAAALMRAVLAQDAAAIDGAARSMDARRLLVALGELCVEFGLLAHGSVQGFDQALTTRLKELNA